MYQTSFNNCLKHAFILNDLKNLTVCVFDRFDLSCIISKTIFFQIGGQRFCFSCGAFWESYCKFEHHTPLPKRIEIRELGLYVKSIRMFLVRISLHLHIAAVTFNYHLSNIVLFS